MTIYSLKREPPLSWTDERGIFLLFLTFVKKSKQCNYYVTKGNEQVHYSKHYHYSFKCCHVHHPLSFPLAKASFFTQEHTTSSWVFFCV